MNATLFAHLGLASASLLVAGLVALPARSLLRRDPTSCYRLFLALLLGALTLLPVQFLVQGRAQERAAAVAAAVTEWTNARWEAWGGSTLPADAPADPSPGLGATSRDVAAHVPVADGAVGGLPTGVRAATGVGTATSSTAVTGVVALDWLTPEVMGALWLAGVAGALACRARRVIRTALLLRRCRPAADPALLELWRRIAGRSPLARRVRLLACAELDAPACVGWLRPLLLVPARPAAAVRGLEWALRHELVHLERGDTWIALVQAVATAALWFHPAAWWFSREISRLRELSCDQVVVEASGGRRRSYALALLDYAALNSPNSPDRTANDAAPHAAGVQCALLHWGRSPSQIRRRIEMLLNGDDLSRGRDGPGGGRGLARWLACSVLLVPAAGQLSAAAALLPRAEAAPACCVESRCDGDDCPCNASCACAKNHLPKAPRAPKVTSAQEVPSELPRRIRVSSPIADEARRAAEKALKHAHDALQSHHGELLMKQKHAELDMAKLEELHKLKLKELGAELGDLDIDVDVDLSHLDDFEFDFDGDGDLDLDLRDLAVDLKDLAIDLGDLGDIDLDLGDLDLEELKIDLGDLDLKIEQALAESRAAMDRSRVDLKDALAAVEKQSPAIAEQVHKHLQEALKHVHGIDAAHLHEQIQRQVEQARQQGDEAQAAVKRALERTKSRTTRPKAPAAPTPPAPPEPGAHARRGCLIVSGDPAAMPPDAPECATPASPEDCPAVVELPSPRSAPRHAVGSGLRVDPAAPSETRARIEALEAQIRHLQAELARLRGDAGADAAPRARRPMPSPMPGTVR